MSETYPRKNHCETLFAGHTPSSIGFECKGTEKFADMQEKSHFSAIFLMWGVRRSVIRQGILSGKSPGMRTPPHTRTHDMRFVGEPVNAREVHKKATNLQTKWFE